MITRKKMRSTPLVLTLTLAAMLALPAVSMAAQPTVKLGTSSSFAILAGTTITNTGPTTINGDVGLHPGTSFTGTSTVTLNGDLHLTDAVALKAKNDLVTAYNDAAGRTPVTRISTELGGKTLKPGVYDSSSGTFHITGTLTLDAQGDPNAVFVFKTRYTLITASTSNVALLNSARFCRIFWKVGSSATLGTNSNFVGHIFALTSISAKTGATIQGQLLARNGGVTLDANTITNGICATTPSLPIHVVKTPDPGSLTVPGWVTYTYRVTNPGTTALGDVVVTDDKISSLDYVSGDTNHDHLLQHGETWVYTGRARLTSTTTNTVTVTANANGRPASDNATVRVTVGTVTGGAIPTTATPWYNLLLAGAVLLMLGLAGGWRATRKIRA